ncbi:hypothetical protein [Amycolatopsis jejuensis]|uniref:hypothetical protein n=1 Tax=Amycolatopsis jejuensis TaxID=330084 RepID=UPI000525418A|nr:hypothetical protein [Amycolatopsis jejuensis]
MRLAGALLVVLAAGAAGAGYWLLAGVVIAALVAAGAVRLPMLGDGQADRWVGGISRLAQVVVLALAFGAYVFPQQPAYAAAGLVVFVAAADFAGLRLPELLVKWLLGLLLVAAAVLVALCLAVAPVAKAGGIGAPNVAAIVVAAVIVLPFLVSDGRSTGRALALGLVAVVVTVVVLLQLGPVRLGLSGTAFRDLLYAADAGQLQSLLTVVVVLATVPAALTTFTDARERYAPSGELPGFAGGLGAAVAAVFVPVWVAVLVAGLGTVAELVLRVRIRRYRGGHD